MKGKFFSEDVELTVNNKDKGWTEKIYEFWEETMEDMDDIGPVIRCNYFSPRPYVDEWSPGSEDKGFVYRIGRGVYIHTEKV